MLFSSLLKNFFKFFRGLNYRTKRHMAEFNSEFIFAVKTK